MAVLTADDVMAWRFQTTMLRAGYDQGAVDIFLDRVVDALMAQIADTLQAYEEHTRGSAPL
ncbi:DivIVA domain-containing protein [Actinomyces bowdenii]|uniref:DivIVA domain-containing protein n=1 Tax=Actinomyces bowdenii TaxID=131109 RepID=A0A853EHM0_9ACTO|nr:DivIVA domain-containing protein [Actinomyces bowdenii]MBF0696002.1 DivIVA domain-containing protein [Actinomyces bowdenii]NYS68175.1 DivIVA domain-containing protein [Actinomyces bowdenii]